MKILITGHKGFVGSALFKELESQGHECAGYDLPENDITDSYHLVRYIYECDMVIHVAAVADLYQTAKNLWHNFKINVEATFEIGTICNYHKKKLIFISTCCVYGNTGEDIETAEKTLPKTTEPYACSKVAAEYMLRGIDGLDYSILRIGTVYGPGMRESLFNYVAFDKILSGQTIDIHGDGMQTRQYVYIDDLVEGIVLSVKHFDRINGKTINICGTEKTSVIDTIGTIDWITDEGRSTCHVNSIADRQGQIFHENIDIEATTALIGWEPKTSYIDGIKETFEKDTRFERYK